MTILLKKNMPKRSRKRKTCPEEINTPETQLAANWKILEFKHTILLRLAVYLTRDERAITLNHNHDCLGFMTDFGSTCMSQLETHIDSSEVWGTFRLLN